MRFDLHLRSAVKDQLAELGQELAAWEKPARLGDMLRRNIIDSIVPFEHSRGVNGLTIAGVDGSGDFPALSFGDSFVWCHPKLLDRNRLKP